MQLVNMPASKCMPATLSKYSACAETSINTYSTPLSAISRNMQCRKIGSGVVSSGEMNLPANDMPSVPITPTDLPAARNTEASIYVVVVLPLVPVTPTILSLSQASP